MRTLGIGFIIRVIRGGSSRAVVSLFLAINTSRSLSNFSVPSIGSSLLNYDRIDADENLDTCLDVRAESRAGNESPLNSFRILQSWQCYDGSPNQSFYVLPN